MKDTYIFGGVAVVVICVLIFLFGYSTLPSNTSAPVVAQSQTATAVPFTKLIQGTQSGVSMRANYILTSSEELASLWKLINATTTPPAIDFKKNIVIAVFAGDDANAAIAISKIEDAAKRLVSITIAKPDTACAKKMSESPYELVIAPATELAFGHTDIVTTASCAN